MQVSSIVTAGFLFVHIISNVPYHTDNKDYL